MFSSTAKKIISSFFLTATLSSVLFLLPITLNTNTVSVAYAEEPVTTPAPTTSHVGTTADVIQGRCTSFFSGSVSDCVLLLEYYLMVSVPRQLLLFAANVFDTMWAFGLSSETFTLGNSPDSFINAGWVVCRDVANTFFIFILLYIAIMTIFQRDQKRLLSTLVVVALLINFSMYITKFVIDVGNIFALEFYSSFPVNNNPLVIIPGIEQHSIGSGFMKALESPLENIIQDIPNHKGSFGVQASLIALTGIELLVVTFVFLLSGFYLVGRVVTLWIVMITAPIAFFSLTLPSEVSGLNVWSKWKGELISNSFFPAIFLFFIYIAAKIANGNSWILQNFATDAVGIDEFIKLGLQFAVIIAFLLYGLSKARSMSGAAGTITDRYGRMGTGFVTGAALGGVAIAGRQFAGRGATWLKEKEGVKQLAASKWTRPIYSGINAAASGTWDVRNTAPGKQMISKSQGLLGGNLIGSKGFAESKMQSTQESLKKYQSQYDVLKGNPSSQASYIASLHNFINGDDSALLMWNKIPANERQKLIDTAKTDDQEYLKKLNTKLAEGYNPETRGKRTREESAVELKAQFDTLKEDPKAQIQYIEDLFKEGKKDQLESLMGKLSTKERFDAIKKIQVAEVKEYLVAENKKIVDKLKPEQKKTEDKEWKGLVTMDTFKESLKNYKAETLDTEKKKLIEEEVKKNLSVLSSSQVLELEGDDLIEDVIAHNLSSDEVRSIKKTSGTKLKRGQADELYKKIREGSSSQEARDLVTYSTKETPVTRRSLNR
ncbi:MAG: hypothetical protein NT098_05885 [Candidatus Parcubacteria bacterium]|nr:hypothetical protein [Candidatus Parcubacteria bacterium]